jgi:hypothetical protein
MSQTESLGVADASRWTSVAASLVDYLRIWLGAEQSAPPAPKGVFAGARRFLDQALAGIALERRERPDPKIPIMAGITNLTIALGVTKRLSSPDGNLRSLEETLNGYLESLEAVTSNQPRTAELVQRVQSLKAFFQELQLQGNRARHAAFAQAEAPRT